jgi:hypothetical protein
MAHPTPQRHPHPTRRLKRDGAPARPWETRFVGIAELHIQQDAVDREAIDVWIDGFVGDDPVRIEFVDPAHTQSQSYAVRACMELMNLSVSLGDTDACEPLAHGQGRLGYDAGPLMIAPDETSDICRAADDGRLCKPDSPLAWPRSSDLSEPILAWACREPPPSRRHPTRSVVGDTVTHVPNAPFRSQRDP